MNFWIRTNGFSRRYQQKAEIEMSSNCEVTSEFPHSNRAATAEPSCLLGFIRHDLSRACTDLTMKRGEVDHTNLTIVLQFSEFSESGICCHCQGWQFEGLWEVSGPCLGWTDDYQIQDMTQSEAHRGQFLQRLYCFP